MKFMDLNFPSKLLLKTTQKPKLIGGSSTMSAYYCLNFFGLEDVQSISIILMVDEIRSKRYLETGACVRFLWTSPARPPVLTQTHTFFQASSSSKDDTKGGGLFDKNVFRMQGKIGAAARIKGLR